MISHDLSFSPIAVIVALLCFALVAPGCERDPADSPPVTLGTAPASTGSDDLQDEEPEADVDPEDQQPAQLAHQDQAVPTVALPEGTAEQQELMMSARTAFLTDNYEDAERAFLQLSTSEPVTGTTVSAAIALAQIFVETGRPEQALNLMAELQENVEDLPEILLVIARVYSDLDRPGEALKAYDQAIQKQPNFIFILTEMAEILLEAGEEEKAGILLIRYEKELQEMATALEATDRTTPQHRLYIVDIFSMLHDELAHNALIAALDDPAPHVRQHAAQALGELGVPEAREPLQKLAIEDESDLVRPAARQALHKLR